MADIEKIDFDQMGVRKKDVKFLIDFKIFGLSLDKIGKKYHCSKQNVSQRIKKIADKVDNWKRKRQWWVRHIFPNLGSLATNPKMFLIANGYYRDCKTAKYLSKELNCSVRTIQKKLIQIQNAYSKTSQSG